MNVATYFFYRGGTGPVNMVESRVAYIDVWGDAPKGALGKTGRGLALGSTLAQQKAVYGDRYSVMYPAKGESSSVQIEWADGAFLMIDYGPSGHSDHMRLTSRER
jgi:hypothetical protein